MKKEERSLDDTPPIEMDIHSRHWINSFVSPPPPSYFSAQCDNSLITEWSERVVCRGESGGGGRGGRGGEEGGGREGFCLPPPPSPSILSAVAEFPRLRLFLQKFDLVPSLQKGRRVCKRKRERKGRDPEGKEDIITVDEKTVGEEEEEGRIR